MLRLTTAVLLLAACGSSPEPAPPDGPDRPERPSKPDKNTAKDAVARLAQCDGFALRGDARIAECYREPGTLAPQDPPPPYERDPATHNRGFIAGFDGLAYDPMLTFHYKDHVVQLLRVGGTANGAYGTKVQPGRAVGLMALRKVDVVAGLLDLRAYADRTTLTSQLGIGPYIGRPVLASAVTPIVVAGDMGPSADKPPANEAIALVVLDETSLDAGDAAASAALHTDDFVLHELRAPRDVVGDEAYRTALERTLPAYKGLTLTAEHWSAGDYVISEGRWTAEGSVGQGLAVADVELAIHRIVAGKIPETWRYSDMLPFGAAFRVYEWDATDVPAPFGCEPEVGVGTVTSQITYRFGAPVMWQQNCFASRGDCGSPLAEGTGEADNALMSWENGLTKGVFMSWPDGPPPAGKRKGHVRVVVPEHVACWSDPGGLRKGQTITDLRPLRLELTAARNEEDYQRRPVLPTASATVTFSAPVEIRWLKLVLSGKSGVVQESGFAKKGEITVPMGELNAGTAIIVFRGIGDRPVTPKLELHTVDADAIWAGSL